MRLVRLHVEHFGPVRKACVDLGPGLNVLYGENDLGKSYLARAIRAALLLPHTSTAHQEFVAWGTDETPRVELTFQTNDETYWRVKKAFGKTAGAAATLERSPNAEQWSMEAKGRDVDGQLRRLLEWGIPEPGGKGKRLPKGLPSSFLTHVLLAEQDGATAVFEQSLVDDPDESGKQLLAQALQALAQDPLFKAVLETSQQRVDEAFLPSGMKRRGQHDPFPRASRAIREAQRDHERCKEQLEETRRVEDQLRTLSHQRLEAQAAKEEAAARLAALEATWHKQRELREAAARLAEAEERTAKVEAAQTAAAQLAAALAEREEGLEQAGEALRRAELAVEEASAQHHRLERGLGALLLWRGAVADLEEARAARGRMAELRQEAEELRTEGDALLADLASRELPAGDRVRELRALAQELEVAQARLDVGLSVRVRLSRALDLEVSRDGGAPERRGAATGEHLFESQRAVALKLGDVAEVDVEAGAAEARRTAEELAKRWREEAVPVLRASGVGDVEALEDALRVAEMERRIAEERLAESARLEAKAAELAGPASGLEACEAQAKEREAALEGHDRAALEAVAQTGGGVREAEETLRQVQAGAEGAVTALEKAKAFVGSRTEARDEAKGAIEGKRGELGVLRENAEGIDLPAARAAAEEARAAVEARSGAAETVTEQRLAEARQSLDQAAAALAEKSREVDKLEGALEQVGGDVAVEREKTALETLLVAKDRERGLELEYGAWRLLVETLREAENEESTHLGRALIGPVSERFSELTNGRYGRIGLDPDLKTTGIRAGGGDREVAALSQGLKEQLATIFRISVAQHLESVIVLDDHLTNADPERLSWFREVLRRCGEEIQIVVLTCRPTDYLLDGELVEEGRVVWDGSSGRIRGVNLQRIVERAGVVAGGMSVQHEI